MINTTIEECAPFRSGGNFSRMGRSGARQTSPKMAGIIPCAIMVSNPTAIVCIEVCELFKGKDDHFLKTHLLIMFFVFYIL
jgi:hypothetical protein